MLVSTFDTFVRKSDHSVNKSLEERLDIATYGLAAEIGSVVAAVKKRLLAEGGAEDWNAPNEEIIEELGDVIWYGFSLSNIVNSNKPINIFAHDVAKLKKEIDAGDDRAERIRGVLDPSKRDEFLKAAEVFPKRTKKLEFEDYQTVAFLTARTKDRTLVEVCLAVLWQLSAQLFRRKLPLIERELNKALVDRSPNDILGEIAWHVAALASIYRLKLSDIAEKNIAKVSFRIKQGEATQLHDEGCISSQKFPRYFEISFITVAKGRSRMYLGDRQLGSDLTDNSYEDDGYRYHDIMHLANVAKLGWSPVLRGLMGLKRKGNPRTDEVEDGARAQIVEEAVIKAIHSEGQRIAGLLGPPQPNVPRRLFPSNSDITFRFLKFVRNFVADLEVHGNRYWEWEDAILAGYDIFHRLRLEGQGTVAVDLNSRTLTFKPEVCINLVGRIAGLGSAYFDSDMLACDTRFKTSTTDASRLPDRAKRIRNAVQQLAVLDALEIRRPGSTEIAEMEITEVEGRGISVKATGSALRAMWNRNVVAVRTTVSLTASGGAYCAAIAVAN